MWPGHYNSRLHGTVYCIYTVSHAITVYKHMLYLTALYLAVQYYSVTSNPARARSKPLPQTLISSSPALKHLEFICTQSAWRAARGRKTTSAGSERGTGLRLLVDRANPL